MRILTLFLAAIFSANTVTAQDCPPQTGCLKLGDLGKFPSHAEAKLCSGDELCFATRITIPDIGRDTWLHPFLWQETWQQMFGSAPPADYGRRYAFRELAPALIGALYLAPSESGDNLNNGVSQHGWSLPTEPVAGFQQLYFCQAWSDFDYAGGGVIRQRQHKHHYVFHHQKPAQLADFLLPGQMAALKKHFAADANIDALLENWSLVPDGLMFRGDNPNVVVTIPAAQLQGIVRPELLTAATQWTMIDAGKCLPELVGGDFLHVALMRNGEACAIQSVAVPKNYPPEWQQRVMAELFPAAHVPLTHANLTALLYGELARDNPDKDEIKPYRRRPDARGRIYADCRINSDVWLPLEENELLLQARHYHYEAERGLPDDNTAEPIVIDKKTRQPLQVSDIVLPNQAEALQNIVAARHPDPIDPVERWYFDAGNLVFITRAGLDGTDRTAEVEIAVPATALENIIKPRYLQAIQH